MSLNHFYTYLLLDPRKPGKYPINEHFSLLYEPFYVGYSGREVRLSGHIGDAKNSKKNSLKLNKIRKILKQNLEPLEFRAFNELSKEQSVDFEIYLIAHIGRIDLGTGILTNGTKGGDGGDTISNHNNRDLISKNQSTRMKGNTLHKGKKKSQAMKGENNPNYGRIASEETRKKMSAKKKGVSPKNKRPSKYPDIDLNMILICQCGCGEKIVPKKSWKWDGIPRYKFRHKRKKNDR